jgi:hypothetical protein
MMRTLPQFICVMALFRLLMGGASAQSDLEVGRPSIERQEIRAQLMPRRYTTIAAEIGANTEPNVEKRG